MRYKKLGNSDINVSVIGFGTQNFGTTIKNKNEVFEIIQLAIDNGINLFDTAEIYPSPISLKLPGLSEIMLGEYLEKKNRQKIIISTKIAGGYKDWFSPPVRNGKTFLNIEQIKKAFFDSLKRLKTDYIDIYTLHWDDSSSSFDDIIGELNQLIKNGYLRYIAISNFKQNRIFQFLNKFNETNENNSFITIQNPFSLLRPGDMKSLSEVLAKNNCPYFAYSPIEGGVLTGKYLKDNLSNTPRRYDYHKKSNDQREVEIYKRAVLSKKNCMAVKDLVEKTPSYLQPHALSLAWVLKNDFVTSALISVNSKNQFYELHKSLDLKLDKELLLLCKSIYSRFITN